MKLPSASNFNRIISIISIVFAYCVLSLLFFYRKHSDDAVFGFGDDPISFVWFLNWWPYAIFHHINPFISKFVWSPIGSNLMWSTSVPTLSLLAWPISEIFGPITSWNILALSAPVFNSITCFLLLSAFSRDTIAAAVGAIFFGFSSYITGQMLGHLNLYFVAIIPIYVLLVVKRLQQKISRLNYVLLLSLFAILQFGISIEILATSAFFGALSFVAFYAVYRTRYDFIGVVFDSVCAAFISVLVLSPALYYLFIGLKQVPQTINDPSFYSADVLNFLVPTPVTRIGKTVFIDIANRFSGNFSEEGAYLGFPLVLILILSVQENIEKRWIYPTIFALTATIICALGPVLWINGHAIHVWMPWRVFLHAPLLQHALPTRFVMFTTLIVAVLATLWLDKANLTKWQRTARYSLALIAGIFIIPNPSLLAWSKTETPDIFEQKAIEKLFGQNATLVVLPYGPQGGSMLWQIKSNMSFKMAGGYVGITPNYFNQFSAIGYFSGAPLPLSHAKFENDVNLFCGENGVKGIIISNGTVPMLATALLELPWPHTNIGQSTVLFVPSHLTYIGITGDYWGGDLSNPQWIGKSVNIVNHTDKPLSITISTQWVPANVLPIPVSLKIGLHAMNYNVGLGKSEQNFVIPPFTTATLTAEKTWAPDLFIHNGDTRSLSVAMQYK